MVAGSGLAPRPARRVAGPVQVQGYSYDLEVADQLSLGFLPDLVDEPVHRGGHRWEVGAEPPPIELCGHRRVVVGGDVDDARDVGKAIVVAGAGDRRNELVLRVPLVLVVLAKLVAVVRLPE